jgi:hypothetical protein
VADTVATPGADDCQFACDVTSDVDPVLCVAVAAICRVWPASSGLDASPVARSWTAVVVGVGATGVGAGSSEPQAATPRQIEASTREERRVARRAAVMWRAAF